MQYLLCVTKELKLDYPVRLLCQKNKYRTKEKIKLRSGGSDKKQTAVEEMEGTVPYAHSRNSLHFYLQLHTYVWSDNCI